MENDKGLGINELEITIGGAALGKEEYGDGANGQRLGFLNF